MYSTGVVLVSYWFLFQFRNKAISVKHIPPNTQRTVAYNACRQVLKETGLQLRPRVHKNGQLELECVTSKEVHSPVKVTEPY